MWRRAAAKPRCTRSTIASPWSPSPLAGAADRGTATAPEGLAHVFGARYSRYADDLVFSGPAALRPAFQRLEALVARAAREEGYQVNHRKTRLSGQAGRQQVCGVVVNRHPNLPRAEFDRLRAELHQCVMHGPATQNRGGVPEYRAHLRGRIDWAAQLNPAKAQRLQALWARIDWS